MNIKKNQIIEICKKIYDLRWAANHEGNATIKINNNHILATPTAESKGGLAEDMLILVDENANVIEGDKKPFSEISLHFAIYKTRSDVKAVLHSHSPYATAHSVCGLEINNAIIAEPIVSIGDKVPLVPFAMPNTKESEKFLSDAIKSYDCVLLENHGVITVGCDINQAFLRMEHVEHMAKINFLANKIGELKFLSDENIKYLLEKRKKAGFIVPKNSNEDKLKEIIKEEVCKALKT